MEPTTAGPARPAALAALRVRCPARPPSSAASPATRRACVAIGALVAIAIGVTAARPLHAQPAATPTPTPTPTPTAPAAGAPSDADRAAARTLISSGDKLATRGDYLRRKGKEARAVAEYERALAAYQQAHALTRNPQIYYAMATAEEKLGRWLDAVRHYQAMLAEAADARPELRTAAAGRIEDLKQHLGTITLHVEPAGANVMLDGVVLGAAPLAEPLILGPGDYVLGITADGHTPLETRLAIEAGSESERTFELEPIPVIVEPPRPLPPPRPRPRPVERPRNLVLLVSTAATVALAASATGVGLLAVAKHGEFTDTNLDAASREDARTSGQTFARVTDVLLVGTVAAAAFTTYYYVSVYRPKVRAYERQERDAEAAVAVTPYLDSTGGGLVVGGRF